MTDAERLEWLEARRAGVGSSDAAPVCGRSPFDTSLGIYMDKLRERTVIPTKAMRNGLILEPAIAAMYEAETDTELVGFPHTTHPRHPWMMATPDRRRVHERIIVELKKASSFARLLWGQEKTDEIPELYIIQVQHQLACTGFDHAHVAALVGDDLRIYYLERSDRLIKRMMEIEYDFWHDNVLRQIPPDLNWRHASTAELLKHIYKSVNPIEIELSEQLAPEVRAYQACSRGASIIKKKQARIKTFLLSQMGDAGKALLPDGTALIRQEVNRRAFEVKATSFITMRVQKPKGGNDGDSDDGSSETSS